MLTIINIGFANEHSPADIDLCAGPRSAIGRAPDS